MKDRRFYLPVYRKNIGSLVGKKYNSLMGHDDLIIVEDDGVKNILGLRSSKYVLISNEILYKTFEEVLKEISYSEYEKILQTDLLTSTGEYIIQPEVERNVCVSFRLVHSYAGRVKTALYIGIYSNSPIQPAFATYAANEEVSFTLSEDKTLRDIEDSELKEVLKEKFTIAVMSLLNQKPAVDIYEQDLSSEIHKRAEAEDVLRRVHSLSSLPAKTLSYIDLSGYFLKPPYSITTKQIFFELQRYLYNSQYCIGDKVKIDKQIFNNFLNL